MGSYRIPVRMTERQVELVRDGTFFDPHFGTGCRKVSTGRVVELSPEDLEHLIGYVSEAANHTDDKKLEKEWDRLGDKLEAILAKGE